MHLKQVKHTTRYLQLQQDHSHARRNSADDIHAEAKRPGAELGNGKTCSCALGARARGAVAVGADHAGAGSARRLEKVGAARSSRGSNGSLGGGLALETTAAGDVFGVDIGGKGQLVLVGAHAVRAVGANGSVLVDTSAVLALLFATDEVEHVGVVILVGLVSNNTAECFHHARAELGIGYGWENLRLGFPLASGDLGARSCGSVAWGVVAHLDTTWGRLGNLLGQVVKVLVGGDLAARNSSETYI